MNKHDNEAEETTVLIDDADAHDIDSVAFDEKGPGFPAIGYEEAIEAAGYGRFHYLLLMLCGWSVSSDAVEILCASFVLPSAGCELQLTSHEKGWLNSVIFIGMMIGGYFWGTLADQVGRKTVLQYSLMVNAIGGLCSSFAQVFWLYLLCRLFSGIGVGGSMPVIFTYFTEFQPKKGRGKMISLLATFWMTGNIVTAGLAWLVIPRTYVSFHTADFSYSSWRVFIALCTIPALTSALLYVLMPESPRYLMQMGREKDAQNVFHRIQRGNKIRSSYIDFRIFKSTVKLYQNPLTVGTVILSVINFSIAFGYYGLWMWFPELFKRLEVHGGSICDIHLNQSVPIPEQNCTFLATNTNIYFEGFLTALSNLPGNILTIMVIDRIGRKILLSSSLILSGVSVFFIWFVKNKTQSVVMSCVFGGISVIAFNALDVIGVEIFPTQYRSTANGVMNAIGRIAAILANQLFGLMVDVHCAVPMILVAILLTIGGICAIKLPNKQDEDLE